MHEIIIITNRKERFASFVKGLRGKPDYLVGWKDSLKNFQDRGSATAPALMVIDEEIGGISNFEIARQIVMMNPMINLALVSGLSSDDFHEAGEGLGILAQLPRHPGKDEALKLVELMAKILSPQDAVP